MIYDPRLVLIGSAGRNAGKTFLALKLLSHYVPRRDVYGLKVTCINAKGAACPHGGAGCGACSINADFCLTKETVNTGEKDTALMLAGGAKEVWWLRSLRAAMESAYLQFAGSIPASALCIAESNSLRLFVKPAVFIMLNCPGGGMKESAREVAEYADITVNTPLSGQDIPAILKTLSRSGLPA